MAKRPNPSSPLPVNRAMPPERVRVRACAHLAESVDGLVRRYAPGEQFEVTAARAAALGRLVDLVSNS